MSKYEKQKGTNFEVTVAKTICKHFKLVEWPRFLPRTRVGTVYHSSTQKAGQLMGDLYPTGDMTSLTSFKYPIECKDRRGWSFQAILKNFQTSKVYTWWKEAAEEIDPALWPYLLVFTQTHAPVLVMHDLPLIGDNPAGYLVVSAGDKLFTIELLRDFLLRRYPIEGGEQLC